MAGGSDSITLAQTDYNYFIPKKVRFGRCVDQPKYTNKSHQGGL